MEGISLFPHIKMWLWCCEGCAVPGSLRCAWWLCCAWRLWVIWYFILFCVVFFKGAFLYLDATLVIGGIFLFSCIKMKLWCLECLECLAVPHGQHTVFWFFFLWVVLFCILFFLQQDAICFPKIRCNSGDGRIFFFLLTSRWDSDARNDQLCFRASIVCFDIFFLVPTLSYTKMQLWW